MNIPQNCNIIIVALGDVKEEGATITNEQLYTKLSSEFDQKIQSAIDTTLKTAVPVMINTALKTVVPKMLDTALETALKPIKEDLAILKREALVHGWDLSPNIEENTVQSEQAGQEESKDSQSQENTEEPEGSK